MASEEPIAPPPPDLQHNLELVVRTGLFLTKTHDLHAIVQAATDAGLELCSAQFGAFFYFLLDEAGERHLRYAFSGMHREMFTQFPLPGNTALFSLTFEGTGVVRSADITQDPHYGKSGAYAGMPSGHFPVRSYLAIPVRTASGEVLGGLFYGHAEPGIFAQESEDLVATVAAQAAVAIENARLRNELTLKIRDLESAHDSQKEAGERLSELAAIVESSDDAIISKDLNGIITSWNKAASRILGYTPGEMIGQSILKLIPDHLHSDEEIILSRIRSGQRIHHFETVRRARDGQLLDVSITVSPLMNQSGKVVGASKILRDISSRKRMETSLLQAEKIAATGRMAATIAHEINNPLEAVLNLLYLLRPLVSRPDGVLYLQSAEIELNRVAHIAKQTLGYFRENALPVSASLSDLVTEAIGIYSPRCLASNIRIESSLDSRRKLVLRRGEMMQVISNLIVNAIYAMPDGGTLRLSTRDVASPREGVQLCVEDTGVGIPEDVLPRIFEAFFTTRATIGTGIGLFIAGQFVEAHGGEITVRSSVEPDAHGTTLCIFLPLHTTYETAPPAIA